MNLIIADILESAADHLFNEGHLKHDSGFPGGPRCATGHISTAVAEHLNILKPVFGFMLDSTDSVLFAAACDALAFHLFDQSGRSYQITNWNDEPERTEWDVRDALFATAKELRNGN